MSRVRKIGAVILLVMIGTGVAFTWWYERSDWIPAGYVGIMYNANGGVDRAAGVIPPRRIYVGWRQRLYQYPTRLMNALYTQDPDEGEDKSADGVTVTTKDNQNTIFDISVIYHIKKEDVFTAFTSFGAIPVEDVQRQHIRRALKEAANNVSTQYDIFELMGKRRAEASDKLTAEMNRLLAYKGITIDRAFFLQCEPDNNLQAKINARVNAQTDLEISNLRALIADQDRQTAVVLAEAQNQARQMSAATTQGTSIEMLQLQTTEAAIEKWDGHLPRIQSRAGQTLVIGAAGLPLTREGESK